MWPTTKSVTVQFDADVLCGWLARTNTSRRSFGGIFPLNKTGRTLRCGSFAASLDDSPADTGYHSTMQPSTVANQWYVSFALANRRARRTTQTFETESQAKALALQSLEEGFAPSAGTLNPRLPKRTISPADLETWARSE